MTLPLMNRAVYKNVALTEVLEVNLKKGVQLSPALPDAIPAVSSGVEDEQCFIATACRCLGAFGGFEYSGVFSTYTGSLWPVQSLELERGAGDTLRTVIDRCGTSLLLWH